MFDGWQQGHPSEQREHRAGVQVIYSKRGERADQVIQRLAQQYGADCAVVSSDQEIVNAARAYGAFVIGSREFAEKLLVLSPAARALPNKELDLRMTIAPSAGRRRREILESFQRRRGSETADSGDFEQPLGVHGGRSLDIIQGTFVDGVRQVAWPPGIHRPVHFVFLDREQV